MDSNDSDIEFWVADDLNLIMSIGSDAKSTCAVGDERIFVAANLSDVIFDDDNESLELKGCMKKKQQCSSTEFSSGIAKEWQNFVVCSVVCSNKEKVFDKAV
jgi:hypothetical protein